MQQYQDHVTDQYGNAQRGASVLVKTAAGATATIYSDDGVTLKDNPITTGANGAFEFYAANGSYVLNIDGVDSTRFTLLDVTEADTATPLSSSTVVGETGGVVKRFAVDELAPVYSAAWAGTTGDGTTDDATALTAALNSGYAEVVIPPGSYRVRSSCVATNAALKRIVGYGATILVDVPGTTNTYAIDTGTNNIPVHVEGLTIQAYNPATTREETWYGGTFSYLYQAYQAGMYLPDGSTVEHCSFKQLVDALYMAGTSAFAYQLQTRVLNCTFEKNLLTFTGYLLNTLLFSGNVAYLGSELTFPSCRNLVISDNPLLFLPGTPCIDVGGSAAANGSQCIISNNVAYGRDGIVVELGCDDVVITGNQCYSMNDTPNGYGIGISTNTGGQEISRLVINNNKISRYADPAGTASQYAFGIRVFASIDTAMRDIQVENNQIIAAGTAIQIEGYDTTPLITGVSVRNNTGRDFRVNGLVIGNADYVHVAGNDLTSNGTVIASYGIYLSAITRGRVKDNITRACKTSHYYFAGACSDVVIDSPDHDASSEALLWGFDAGHTGNMTCRNVVFPTGGTPAVGKWTQGSSIINPVPASAAYYGAVCTVAGTPGTWKGFGLIA